MGFPSDRWIREKGRCFEGYSRGSVSGSCLGDAAAVNQKQDQHNDEQETESPAGIIAQTPAMCVRPRRQEADQQQKKNDNQQQTEHWVRASLVKRFSRYQNYRTAATLVSTTAPMAHIRSPFRNS